MKRVIAAILLGVMLLPVAARASGPEMCTIFQDAAEDTWGLSDPSLDLTAFRLGADSANLVIEWEVRDLEEEMSVGQLSREWRVELGAIASGRQHVSVLQGDRGVSALGSVSFSSATDTIRNTVPLSTLGFVAGQDVRIDAVTAASFGQLPDGPPLGPYYYRVGACDPSLPGGPACTVATFGDPEFGRDPAGDLLAFAIDRDGDDLIFAWTVADVAIEPNRPAAWGAWDGLGIDAISRQWTVQWGDPSNWLDVLEDTQGGLVVGDGIVGYPWRDEWRDQIGVRIPLSEAPFAWGATLTDVSIESGADSEHIGTLELSC